MIESILANMAAIPSGSDPKIPIIPSSVVGSSLITILHLAVNCTSCIILPVGPINAPINAPINVFEIAFAIIFGECALTSSLG